MIARGERWVGECDNVRKDGEVVRVEAVVFQLEDERGEPVSIVGVSRDITARQRAEAARREVEARLASIIDHVPATVFLRDLRGNFIMVNRHYADFYELDPGAIVGRRNRDLFSAEIARESDAHDREVIDGRRVAEREYTIERSDGTRILWSVKFPIKDEAGEMIAVGGVELDITERKRTEALLRAATEAAAAAEARLADAIEHMSEAIVVYDENDGLLLCNSRFKEFYQYDDEDVKSGVRYSELARLDLERGIVIADPVPYLQSGRGERARLLGTVDVELRDGRWLQIRERTTSAGHIVSIQADVTDRKHAELALREAKEEAELANRAKSRFLANMSHELRTPLNAIIGITELLEEQVAEAGLIDRLGESLRRIHGAGRQLLQLIDDILDLSKIEAGRMELHPVEFPLRRLIEEVATTARPLAEKNGNVLHVHCEPAIGSVHLDEMRMRQVILNLLSNACKFSRDGRIDLEVAQASHEGRDGIRVSVKDEGIGISPAQMRKLFEPFSQGDPSMSRKYGGTGLGLAISRHFCQMLSGHLSVESELGRGSTFRAWFPRTFGR
jgi:PAS domain S-box-containing protein